MTTAFLSLLLLLLLRSASGVVICEELPPDLCAFSISSSAKRCVLESSLQHPSSSHGAERRTQGTTTEYQCRTSEVVVERMAELIETDECVAACGVDRGSVGISSDPLLEPRLTERLCSPECYQNCPNIIDLHFNLAAAEGIFLPDMCEAQRNAKRHNRAMEELVIKSSGAAPPAPMMMIRGRGVVVVVDDPEEAVPPTSSPSALLQAYPPSYI